MFFKNRLSLATIFWAFFTIVSAFFVRQLTDKLSSLIGRAAIDISLKSLIIGVLALAVALGSSGRYSLARKTAFILVAMLSLVIIWKVRDFPQRVHVMEYGVLGFLAGRDALKGNEPVSGLVFALVFCLTVGLIDETVQFFLPFRIFDPMDIWLNWVGSAWGIILCIACPRCGGVFCCRRAG